jgi:hypothetical protein
MYEEMKEANPGLEGMEKGVLAALHGFGNALLSALAGMRSEKYPVPTITCVCGEQAHYQRKRRGECKTLVGTIELKRAYYLCSHCHRRRCPLDKQLGFCAGSISAGLDELLALLGCQFSFAQSAEMVKQLTWVEVSANRCRRSTEALGQLVAAEEESVRHQVWEQPTLYLPLVSQAAIDPLYVSADGVTVHTRESGWREQCVGAVYTTKRRRQEYNHQWPQSN